MKRNRVLYGFFLLFAAVLVFLNNGKVAYVMFYTMLLLPLVSLAMGLVFLNRLEISQEVERDLIVKGDHTGFLVDAVNRSILLNPEVWFIFPEGNFAVESNVCDTAISFAPNGRENLDFDLACKYRGVYEIGLLAVQTKDPLGLFRLNRRLKDEMRVVVYPRVIEIVSFPLSMNLASKSYSRFDAREEDYSSISDVRPYVDSDNIKRIHWKLSAKRNELIVKNFESTALNSIILFVDTSRIGVIYEDKIIEIAVAVGYYCLKKQLPVDLHAGPQHRLETAGVMDFEELYSECAHLVFEAEEPLDNMLAAYLQEQTNALNLVILTARMSEALLGEVSRAWYFGHFVSLIYVPVAEESEDDQRVFEILREIGIPCFRVGLEDEIVDIF